MTVEPYVIRDLGRKLAEDFADRCLRTVSLIGPTEFEAQIDIVLIAMSTPVAALLGPYLALGKTLDEARAAVIADVTRTLAAFDEHDEPIRMTVAIGQMMRQRAGHG